jgi:hypothetical protein
MGRNSFWTDMHTQGNQPAVTSCNWKHVTQDLNATSDINSASPLLTNELGKDECRPSQDHDLPRAAITHKRAALATAQGVTDNQLVPYKKLRNVINWNVLYNWPRSLWAVERLDIRAQPTGNTWNSGHNISTTYGRQGELPYHILKENLLFFTYRHPAINPIRFHIIRTTSSVLSVLTVLHNLYLALSHLTHRTRDPWVQFDISINDAGWSANSWAGRIPRHR